MGTSDEYLTNYGSAHNYYWNESIEKDYISWINSNLARASPPTAISHLVDENICNGVAIGLLLETVGNVKLNGLLLQPITRVERLHNVHEVFAVLRRLNVRLDNMQPEDVMNGHKDTIIQLLVAISSYFMLDPRARQTPHFLDGNRRSGSVSPRAPSRHTPTDRYTPSAHYTEIQDPSYSHQVIGPTVYPGENSGGSSPRSRSTMTMIFSGQRSPTGTFKRSPSRIKYDTAPSPQRACSPSYPPVQPPVHLGPPAQHNLINLRRSAPELPHYVDSMNELSKLKTKLHAITRLISADNIHSLHSTSSGLHTGKAVQSDNFPRTEIEKELHFAKQQIVELTRMLQAKDALLRKTEEENIRLNDLLCRLRDVELHTSSTVDNSSTRSPYPLSPRNRFRSCTSPTQLGQASNPAHVRPEPSRLQSKHSYDPRLNDYRGNRQVPEVTQPIVAPYQAVNFSDHESQPYRPEPRRARSRNGSVHVKKVSLNLDPIPGPAYIDDSKAPL